MRFLLLAQGGFAADKHLTALGQERIPPLAQHIGVHAALTGNLGQAPLATDDLEGPAGFLFRRIRVSFPSSWHVPNLLYFGPPECLKILGHYIQPAMGFVDLMRLRVCDPDLALGLLVSEDLTQGCVKPFRVALHGQDVVATLLDDLTSPIAEPIINRRSYYSAGPKSAPLSTAF